MRRREFLKFLGYGAIAGATPLRLPRAFAAKPPGAPLLGYATVVPNGRDELVLAEGLTQRMLIKWRDPINARERFGSHNDYLALLEQPDGDAILWVNHEYLQSLFVSGYQRSRAAIDAERAEVGGSLLRLRRDNNGWLFVPDDPLNRRIDGTTFIPFAGGVSIKGSNRAEGTVGNCAGGVTPWNTFLTCEENFQEFYAVTDPDTGAVRSSRYKWEQYYPNPAEHYGWVAEVDPFTGAAKKHVTLGRFAHECATCILSGEGHTVVYTADDKDDECLYKFVADRPDTLESGTLYVASLEQGRWLALDWHSQPLLREHFADQLEIYVYTRKAAHLLGATPLARPEDIEINPITGDVFIALTNNKPKGDFHGQILKLSERGGDHASLEFSSEVFLTGGDDGFSCADNLAFDARGNLWFSSDISGDAMHRRPYEEFGNNGLYVVPTQGEDAGEVFQLASAPVDAELTGLYFDAAQKTLFVAVQHPGEMSRDLEHLTSHWPNGGAEVPLSAVVQIRGPLLERLTGAA